MCENFIFVSGLRRTSPPSMPSPRSEYGIHLAGNPPFSFNHVVAPCATEMAGNLQKCSVITWKKWNEMHLPFLYTGCCFLAKETTPLNAFIQQPLLYEFPLI